MKYRNIKPISVIWQVGAEEHNSKAAVKSGIRSILRLAGVLDQYRRLRSENNEDTCWLATDDPFDTDVFIKKGRDESKLENHLNSAAILEAVVSDPTRTSQPRYDLVIVREPLHFKHTSTRSVLGIGLKEKGAVITYANLVHLLQPVDGEDEENKKNRTLLFKLSLKLTVIHELGHIFGMFPAQSTNNDPTDAELYSSHCTNEDCVMWWKEHTSFGEKIKNNPFCPKCLAKLKNFFLKP